MLLNKFSQINNLSFLIGARSALILTSLSWPISAIHAEPNRSRTQAPPELSAEIDQIESLRTKSLTERMVIDFYRKGSVASREEQAQRSQSELSANLTEEDYAPKLFSSTSYQDSNELAPNPFQPILSPYVDFGAGVEQSLPAGAKLSAELFGVQYSFRGGALPFTVQNATQVGLRAKANFDLWKNFMGSLDRAKLHSARARAAKAQVQHRVNVKKQEIELRKLFWSFVSAVSSVDLATDLIHSAVKQLTDAKIRFREGAADAGEVARYESQVESRKSSKLVAMYNREILLSQFERQFPGFRASEYKVDIPSLYATQPLVDQCIDQISKSRTVDLSTTHFDELIGALREEMSAELRIAEKHSDIDIALNGQYQSTGVSNSFELASANFREELRGGVQVGLKLTIPLGDTKATSEKHLIAAKKNSLEAQSLRLETDLRSTHETMLKSLAFLSAGLKSQIANSKSLEINLKESERKYKQGRIPLTTLITEQDQLFQSRLNEFELRKLIAHTVLDYFSVFSDFKCAWNAI